MKKEEDGEGAGECADGGVCHESSGANMTKAALAETSLVGCEAMCGSSHESSSSLINPNAMPPPSAEHLPLPLSVTINHVYFQRREDHVVAGVTTRYRDKFTTIKYYTHMPLHPIGVCP